MGDDDEAGLGGPRHLVHQVAVALDIVVVERRVDLVEHADWRRVGQKHREDQRHGRQRLLATRKKRHRLRLLARRTRENLKTGFERVVTLDQLEFRRPTTEKMGEKALELVVDDGEGGKKPFSALAIEALNAGAQFADRLDYVLALGDNEVEALGQLRLFLVRTQIHSTQPLALDAQTVEIPVEDSRIGQRVVGL